MNGTGNLFRLEKRSGGESQGHGADFIRIDKTNALYVLVVFCCSLDFLKNERMRDFILSYNILWF